MIIQSFVRSSAGTLSSKRISNIVPLVTDFNRLGVYVYNFPFYINRIKPLKTSSFYYVCLYFNSGAVDLNEHTNRKFDLHNR